MRSRLSELSNRTAWAMSSANGCDPGASTMILVNRSASGDSREMRSSSRCAASTWQFGSVTSTTRPARSACSASRFLAPRSTCFAIETRRARQSIAGAGGCHYAEIGLRIPEDRRRCRDANVAGVGQLCPTAERVAAHGGHGGKRELSDSVEQSAVDTRERFLSSALSELRDVSAACEVVAAPPRKQEQLRIPFEASTNLMQFVDHFRVDRIALRGPVEGDHDAILALVHVQGVHIRSFSLFSISNRTFGRLARVRTRMVHSFARTEKMGGT